MANWLYPEFPVGTKEYRAAFYLEGIEAKFYDDGTPPEADCISYDTFMGYTPMRLYVGTRNVLAAAPQTAQYSRGHGPASIPTQQKDPAGDWVQLSYRAEFKLSFLPNLASRLLVGHWAPYAWCDLHYRFHKNKQVSVEVEGSAIPSQRLYVDWSIPPNNAGVGVDAEYNMLSATPAQVAGFLQTTNWGCRPAPSRGVSLTWQGQAT